MKKERPLERKNISFHEWKVFHSLSDGEWKNVVQIAEETGVAERTVNMHLARFFKLEIIERQTVYPGYRYAVSKKALKKNPGYANRLYEAQKVFSS